MIDAKPELPQRPSRAGSLAERATAAAWLFTLFFVGLVIMEQTRLPWRLIGIGFGVLAIWAGIRTLSIYAALRRAGQARPSGIGMALGLLFTCLMVFQLGAEAAFYPIIADEEQCRAQATTIAEGDACTARFEQRRQEIIDRWSPATATPATSPT